MDGIKIDVTGNIAQVTEKPRRIVAGTVGLPVEFTFDSQWDGLIKTAVFSDGENEIMDEVVDSMATVPWELLKRHGRRLMVGVYGENADGTVAVPTIWAIVSVIHPGAYPGFAPGLPAPAPIWQKLANTIEDLAALLDTTRDELQDLADRLLALAEKQASVPYVTLLAANWEEVDDHRYAQVVSINGVTPKSQVDLTPSSEQLAIFYNKSIAFVAENEDGVITVYAIGQKPENDYTIQVTITEVSV